MGLMRKVFWRSMPKPVRKARRSVHQIAHPVSTARRAVTPKPIKQATRAVYSVGHPIDRVEDAVLNALTPSPQPRRKGGARTGPAPSASPAPLEDKLRELAPLAADYTGASNSEQKAAAGREILHAFFPKRFTDAWFAENVPGISRDETLFGALLLELNSRGWTEADINARVMPHAQPTSTANSSFEVEIPEEITKAWLAENVPAMSQDEKVFTPFLLELYRRGWTTADINARVFPHYAGPHISESD